MLEPTCCECGVKLDGEYEYGNSGLRWCSKCSFKEALIFNLKFFGTIAVMAVIIIILNLILG